MKLKSFRVRSFKSVEDSGLITVDSVASLIGINESGKSNLLLPLWKLNPAQGGEIDPLSDYPRSRYNDIRGLAKKPIFIEANFILTGTQVNALAEITKADHSELSEVYVARQLDGQYIIDFPNAIKIRSISKSIFTDLIDSCVKEIQGLKSVDEVDDNLKQSFSVLAKDALKLAEAFDEDIHSSESEKIVDAFEIDVDEHAETSLIAPRIQQFLESISEAFDRVDRPSPSSVAEACNYVVTNLPKFVYYSNYGNLDSEIYLPHVIQNLARKDLGTKESAKARTLKVLFDFVGLNPQEILDLGKEVQSPTPEQIAETSKKKQEREILLKSASSKLTREFKSWWKQGNYIFDFGADGNHFRIWVSDEKRPEPIELENRSTGLQWFLSFYLVFLVESKDAHDGAILLLDEPGLTLHPHAQKDLSAFFDNLSKTNEIVFSTHSPFMVDADKLDRVRAVFSDKDGRTVVTSDLRSSAADSVQAKSIYAAHAALGLSVSDVFLQGCLPVIVEGQSDQFYLSAIKNYLLQKGEIKPPKEIVFVPGGGSKAIKAVASIMSAKEDRLPLVILDSDSQGLGLAKALRIDLYRGQEDRIILIGELLSLENAEIEDLLPSKLMADIFSRDYRGRDFDFSDIVENLKPMIPQMEKFAKENAFTLSQGWKVDLARNLKRKASTSSKNMDDTELMGKWKSLFDNIINSMQSLREDVKSLDIDAK